MAYSIEIARILTDQLAKIVTLNRHQLVGHAANLDFWTGEVRHVLGVIDGYGPRFERMKAAHDGYVADHGTLEFRLDEPGLTGKPAGPRRVPSRELAEARGRLRDAFYRALVRFHAEGFIDEGPLRRTCDALGMGVESSDLRRRG
ncbi:hypothetical protein [Paludisphaera soli]|uniref:hypothetical protein n=1 Tax=Paludisphaera soli TaxID=2712865 RepID=UPI0013EC2D97|nr:hypothetical protein [Paludisphaera soli]